MAQKLIFNETFVLFLKDGLRILPGENEISDEKVAELKANKDIKRRIKLGQVVFVNDADFEDVFGDEDEDEKTPVKKNIPPSSEIHVGKD